MKTKNVQEQILGLDTASKQRYDIYLNHLRTDRERQFFDDRVRDVILQYAKPDKVAEIMHILNECNAVNFTQSNYEYSQLFEQLQRFAGRNHTNFSWNKNYQTAKSELIAEFKQMALNMISYHNDSDIEEVLPKKSTHAGWQFIISGKRSKGENLEDVYSKYLEEKKKALKIGSFNKLILPGSRTQASGALVGGKGNPNFKQKTRLVSMIDMFLIIAESQFAVPLQRMLGFTEWYAGGKSDPALENRISALRGSYSDWISIDYSGYDQSISDWLIRDAFEIVRYAFKGVFDERLFEVVVNDFIHKIFVDGDGNLVLSNKGVPSGSMFTQIVDSVVNRLIIKTYLASQGITDVKMLIMGDDNLIFFKNGLIDPIHLASYLTKNFGIVVHGDKSLTGLSKEQNPEFLSREWQYGGIWRDVEEIVPKLFFPERFRNYNLEGVDPKMIVYSYILGFNLSMKYLLDVDTFMKDNPHLVKEFRSTDFKWLSGLAAYRAAYET